MSYILNKKLLCSLAIAGTMINSTAFASENPFATVPKDYWAYTAVEHLVETGLVDGYNLTDFHDKKVVARYDLAQFVARAMANENRATAEDKVILNKLQQEYSNELKIMMVMPAEPAPVKEEPQATNNFFDNGKIRFGFKRNVRKAQNVRRAVDLAHLAVDLVNGRIVRQLHVDLAGKVHTLGGERRADDLADEGALAAAHIGHVFRRNGDIMSLCHHFFLFSFRAAS